MSLLSDLAAGALDESYAAAARRQGGRPQPPTGQRWRPVLLAALVLPGLLLAVAATQARRGAPGVSRERTALGRQVSDRGRQVDGLGAAASRLRQQVTEERSAAARSGSAGRAATARLRQVATVTGAAAVSGPGLTVLLADGTGERPRRVTDSDVQQVVNALWAAGGEAVAVDGVRITARTAIRAAGDAILVDFRPLSPPYPIRAIGPPDRLAVDFADSAVAARLRTAAAVYGIGFSLEPSARLLLPAARVLPADAARPGRATPAA